QGAGQRRRVALGDRRRQELFRHAGLRRFRRAAGADLDQHRRRGRVTKPEISGFSGAIKKGWPADRVERRKVGELIPYARNARTDSDEQVSQIAASIREWGWTVPVLIDPEGGLIAGHGRVLAAKKLRLDEVPVMVAEGWSEAQKRAYVLADNKLTLNA